MTERQQPAAYYALLGVTVALTLLGVVTLLPRAAASKPNLIGYRSVCTFAPAASAICALLAGTSCTIRNRLVSRRASSMRFRPLFLPVALGIALAAVAVVFGARYITTRGALNELVAEPTFRGEPLRALRDGTRSASTSEGQFSVTVEVTVESGRVSRIGILSGGEYERRASAELFPAVIEAQSTAVDTVSGATISSRLLLTAIAKAARGR